MQPIFGSAATLVSVVSVVSVVNVVGAAAIAGLLPNSHGGAVTNPTAEMTSSGNAPLA